MKPIYKFVLDEETGKITVQEITEYYMRNDILTKRFGIPMEKENKEELPIWLGKNCKDCGNKKCKELGELPKGYDCALWQPESED